MTEREHFEEFGYLPSDSWNFTDGDNGLVDLEKYICPSPRMPQAKVIELLDRLENLERQSMAYEASYCPWRVSDMLEWDDETDSVEDYIMCCGEIERELVKEFFEIVESYDVTVFDSPRETKKAS